jgi:hypothetical protein
MRIVELVPLWRLRHNGRVVTRAELERRALEHASIQPPFANGEMPIDPATLHHTVVGVFLFLIESGAIRPFRQPSAGAP